MTAARASGLLLPSIVCSDSRDGGVSPEGFLELALRVFGQGRFQYGAAVLAQGGNRLVRRDLLDDQEERRRARLEHVAHLLLELVVDARLLELAHQRSEAGAEGHAEDRHEEEHPEQEAPEPAPGRAA